MAVQNAIDEILTFTDEDETGEQTFNKFPENNTEVGDFWAATFEEAVKVGMVPPIVTLPAFLAATAVFASTMTGILDGPPDPLPFPLLGVIALDAAATAWYTAAVIPGIAPAFLPVLAPLPLSLGPLIAAAMAPFLAEALIGPGPLPVPAATALAGAIKTWIQTGTVSPTGPPVPQNIVLG